MTAPAKPAAGGEAAAQELAHDLMREILPLAEERWIDSAKIFAIPDRLGARDHEPRIYCLREVLGLVRSFPMKMFATPDDRMRLVDAVQQALDKAIQDEGL